MNIDLEIEILRQSHEPWFLMLGLFYYLIGFATVREIYTADEERLAGNPFDRMMHVLIFVGVTAIFWPVIWLNDYCRTADKASE